MKLLNRNHIALVPYTTCNFRCPYCIAHNDALTITHWKNNVVDVNKFLQNIEPKAILLSGGEPLLYDWTEVMSSNNHYWYILSNLSTIPGWIRNRREIKFFIPAFHKSMLSIDKFIANAKTLQDWGFPVFAKIVYNDATDMAHLETLHKNCIPVTLAPLYGTTNPVLANYCWSELYKNRFLGKTHKGLTLCKAGTSVSFEIRGNQLARCSHWYLPITNGTVTQPRLWKMAMPCPIRECACEWHQFSELQGKNDNYTWESLINVHAVNI